MLEEGYIELLAPTHDTPGAARVRERMAKFVGVHLACFGTPDADGEQRRLAAHGFEPPPLENLQREGGTVRFRVVRPKAEFMPEGRIQYVQQMTPEQIWRPEYLKHDNGVLGLSAVYVAASNAAETAARWAQFSGLIPRRDCDLVRLDTSRGKVFVGKAEPAPALAGYALKFREPERFLSRCKKAGLEVRKQAVMLPPALGGAWHITDT
jgi:glyoxalase-like protein